jgi:hypothetical protein
MSLLAEACSIVAAGIFAKLNVSGDIECCVGYDCRAHGLGGLCFGCLTAILIQIFKFRNQVGQP